MVYQSMKRGREEENESITTMANYLLSLSHGEFNIPYAKSNIWERSDVRSPTPEKQYHKILIDNSTTTSRIFECKTCNRQFSSFQALGGHRASHKKPRLTSSESNINQHDGLETSPPKPKIHECSICGQQFNIGQALGGHVRRHRGGGATTNEDMPPISFVAPVVKKSNNRRVMCIDLNLPPLENDIMEFQLGKKVTPLVNCLYRKG